VRSVVVDSGFLIGLFDETDPLHLRCRSFLRDYRGRFLTTEAVLAEALALLSPAQQLRCLVWLGDAAHAGLLHVDRTPLDFRSIEKLARKYSDQPMDFADASVVRRDFAVYRLPGRARFIDVLAQ
jgi:predicted nucleic acid-binding protein